MFDRLPWAALSLALLAIPTAARADDVFYFPSARLDVGASLGDGTHLTGDVLGGVWIGFKRLDLNLVPELGYSYDGRGPSHFATVGAIGAYGDERFQLGISLRYLAGSQAGAFAQGGRASLYASVLGGAFFAEPGGQITSSHGELRLVAGVNVTALLARFVLGSIEDSFK